MKIHTYLLILSIFFVTFFACKKENAKPAVNTVAVEHFLSPQDKDLFDVFSDNMSVQYVDADSNILNFQADSIYTTNTWLENTSDKGEALSVKYSCSSFYFPNYSYTCKLSAMPDQTVDLSIVFGTGTHASSHHNDYVLSSFLFNPNEPTDSVNYFGYTIDQIHLDSITLRDTTFYNVLLDSNLVFNTDPKQTIKCYYSMDAGIVAFENKDGRLWIRK